MIAPVSSYQQKAPTFTGYDPNKFYNRMTDGFTDKIAYFVARMHGKEDPAALINKINSNPKLNEYAHKIMQNLASLAYTNMLVANTVKSKKIEKNRKPMLVINAILVTAASSTLDFIIDKKTKPILAKMKAEYIKAHGLHAVRDKVRIDELDGSLKKTKSIVLFSLIVRLMVPLVMVPITGSIVKYMDKKRAEKARAASIEKFRLANPKLMAEYDKLVALSKKITQAEAQVPVKNTKAADKKSVTTKQKSAS